MNILFLASHFPYPLHSGGALRAHGLIKGAAQAGHEVDLLCFAESLPKDTPINDFCREITIIRPPARSIKDRLKDIAFTRHADMGRRFWSDEMLETLKATLSTKQYHVVHVESIEMTTYSPHIHQWYPNLPLIYGSLNAEADLQRVIFLREIRNPKRIAGAIYSWIQWRRLTHLERGICRISAHVLAVSETDQTILQQFSDTPVTVIKNGIDVAPYLSLERADTLAPESIIFTGSMSYRPNVDAVLWFADEIFPTILGQHPNAHFYVVGHRPHPRVLALQDHPNITITGRVDKIEPYWQGAAVYIAPLRMGSGTRFKLLEAMAAGCAVVSTTIGAQGLGVSTGKELILADTVSEFATAVQNLLENPEKRVELGQNGRTFVRDHFDWSVIVPHLLEVYSSLIQ